MSLIFVDFTGFTYLAIQTYPNAKIFKIKFGSLF